MSDSVNVLLGTLIERWRAHADNVQQRGYNQEAARREAAIERICANELEAALATMAQPLDVGKFISDWQFNSGDGATLFNGEYHQRKAALRKFADALLAAALPPAPRFETLIERAKAYCYGDKTSLEASCEADDILKALAALPPAPPQQTRICDACLREYTGPSENRTLLDLDGVTCPHFRTRLQAALDACLAASGGPRFPSAKAAFDELLCGVPPAPPQGQELTQVLSDMRRASALCDEANGPGDYNMRLVALALIAREYLRRLAASPPAQGWRDIETAPKSERILVTQGYYVGVVRWVQRVWVDDRGWQADNLTHWMPLPALPLAAQEQP